MAKVKNIKVKGLLEHGLFINKTAITILRAAFSVEYFLPRLKNKKKRIVKSVELFRLIRLLINTACHSQMFGSKLKGMRDVLTSAITCIPYPGKIGHQPLTFSVLRNPEKWPRGKRPCHSWSKNSIFFSFAVVWISG